MMHGILCCQNRVEKPFDENKKFMFNFICEGFNKVLTIFANVCLDSNLVVTIFASEGLLAFILFCNGNIKNMWNYGPQKVISNIFPITSPIYLPSGIHFYHMGLQTFLLIYFPPQFHKHALSFACF